MSERVIRPVKVVDVVLPGPKPKHAIDPIVRGRELVSNRYSVILRRRIWQGVTSVGIVLALSLLAYVIHESGYRDPIPLTIRQAAPVAIYYPVQSELPPGYRFNLVSLQTTSQAVLYTVSYGNGQHLIFTLQPKPSPANLQAFYSQHLPASTQVETSVGTAAIGDLNDETVVSLPTGSNTWILATAPLNINQTQLEQVMKAMTIAN